MTLILGKAMAFLYFSRVAAYIHFFYNAKVSYEEIFLKKANKQTNK